MFITRLLWVLESWPPSPLQNVTYHCDVVEYTLWLAVSHHLLTYEVCQRRFLLTDVLYNLLVHPRLYPSVHQRLQITLSWVSWYQNDHGETTEQARARDGERRTYGGKEERTTQNKMGRDMKSTGLRVCEVTYRATSLTLATLSDRSTGLRVCEVTYRATSLLLATLSDRSQGKRRRFVGLNESSTVTTLTSIIERQDVIPRTVLQVHGLLNWNRYRMWTQQHITGWSTTKCVDVMTWR